MEVMDWYLSHFVFTLILRVAGVVVAGHIPQGRLCRGEGYTDRLPCKDKDQTRTLSNHSIASDQQKY